MKQWNTPVVSELAISATANGGLGGKIEIHKDGSPYDKQPSNYKGSGAYPSDNK